MAIAFHVPDPLRWRSPIRGCRQPLCRCSSTSPTAQVPVLGAADPQVILLLPIVIVGVAMTVGKSAVTSARNVGAA